MKMGAKLVDRQLAFMPFFPSDNPGVASGDVTQTAAVLKLADEGLEVLLAAPLHKFWSQEDSLDYGYEIDAVVSRKFGKYFSGLMKYAYHDADSGIPDIHRFWLQAEFNY